jgi:hypothetical protein
MSPERFVTYVSERRVRAKGGKSDGRGARLVAHLRGRGDVRMSTDAIMALTRDD